ncbi:MAG: right-handed parallel beta-helix repeat-containing protein, partial [Sedimentisphaerales bacterium]|nr:right-handed parallel beta-helix repeat-containing protein [Sedimentisphaerales bacterium]
MKKNVSLSLVLLLIISSLAQAAIIRVPQQCATIQQAINDANDGDTIIVSPGRFTENINFNGKNIILTSTDPNNPAIVAATIIDGNRTGSVVTLENGENNEAVLTGFTITGGFGKILTSIPESSYIYWGAGVLCFGSSPTITRNVITGNNGPSESQGTDQSKWRLGYGSGIACVASDATITRNIIRDNFTYAGGGILVYMGQAKIANNLIYDNSAVAGGGAVLIGGSLISNTIVRNQADIGGNIYAVSLPEQPYSVVSNIISNATRGGSIYRDGYSRQDRIAFNNIWNNASGGDAIWGSDKNPDGNISKDPVFVSLQAKDFHLLMDSPCINAGDPNYSGQTGEKDIYGNSRLVYSRVDIGAAEFEGNLRPIASACDDISTNSIPGCITLDANTSYDPDGNCNLTYRWSQVSGPVVTLEDNDKSTAKFSPVEYGAYIFELVVSDGLIDSSLDRVHIVIGSDHIPVADAGLSAYAAKNAVTLNGKNSFDPDGSGTLQYHWQQISGPAVAITDPNTAVPTISGFTQTSSHQICKFQLVVNDGTYQSLPDTVNVIIVPATGGTTMRLENTGSFDPNKPTIVFFGGGDCINGSGSWGSDAWEEKANVINFTYQPDGSTTSPTYERCGDMLIVYLCRYAPDYRQPIQTMGHSTGGQPTIDVAKYLNLMYHDVRYSVNRVSLLDGRCRDYSASILDYLVSSVDGEQCWIDTYEGTGPYFYPGILNVQVAIGSHGAPPEWYKNSLTNPSMNQFSGGLIAGAYWSVVGPGKNLQLAVTPYQEIYKFHWEGTNQSGHMEFFDEPNFPAKLPEPVTLVGPVDVDDANGSVLTCRESANAVGYQLLFGSDPYRVMDYQIISDTNAPPADVVTTLPFDQTWWTIKARDRYGSTIYADPMLITAFNLSLPAQNLTTGKKYGLIQHAVNEAQADDEIIIGPGIYHENIELARKKVTLRSAQPNDPAIIAATVIDGGNKRPVLTVSGGETANCTLFGITIINGSNGISCSNATIAIANCIVAQNTSAGISLSSKSNLTITNSVISGNKGAGIEMLTEQARRSPGYNNATITNCTIVGNLKQGIFGNKPTVTNSIIYYNGLSSSNVQIESNLATIAYSNVQLGSPSISNINAEPSFVSPGYWTDIDSPNAA